MPSGSHFYFMIHYDCAYKLKYSTNWEGVGVNQKLHKKLEKSLNSKILHVKDTDWSNRAVSEIDSEVKIFDIFGHSRPLSPILAR